MLAVRAVLVVGLCGVLWGVGVALHIGFLGVVQPRAENRCCMTFHGHNVFSDWSDCDMRVSYVSILAYIQYLANMLVLLTRSIFNGRTNNCHTTYHSYVT